VKDKECRRQGKCESSQSARERKGETLRADAAVSSGYRFPEGLFNQLGIKPGPDPGLTPQGPDHDGPKQNNPEDAVPQERPSKEPHRRNAPRLSGFIAFSDDPTSKLLFFKAFRDVPRVQGRVNMSHSVNRELVVLADSLTRSEIHEPQQHRIRLQVGRTKCTCE
jgi:hypothetical protein